MYVSRLAGRVLAVGLALWCGASFASAQLLYEQTPSGPAYNHAYLSSPDPYYPGTTFAADSFQLTESALLSRITWWGIYGNLFGQDGVPPPLEYESFVIRIYADNAGQPGAMLATFDTGFKTTSRTATGRIQYWPYEPWANEQPYPVDEYSYKWTLPTPFPIEANTTYWISIVSKQRFGTTARWNWSHSAYPNNLGVMSSWTDGTTTEPWWPAFAPWDDGIQGVLSNAAFRLDSFAPPQHAAYEQALLNDGGGVASSPTGTEWADSFVLTAAGSIKRIIWWGSYAFPTTDTFTIRIYADDAGQPGTELGTYTASAAPMDLALGQVSFEPPYSYIYTWQFEYVLPTPLAVQANTRYWISIVNDQTVTNWLWQASDSTREPGLQFRAATPTGSPWTPQTAPIHDVAFRIETAPPPVFEQRPLHQHAGSSVTNEAVMADWFQLTETTDIARISWFGGYAGAQYEQGSPVPGSDNFTVLIFADNGGQPGAVIATYTPGDQVFRSLTGKNADAGWPSFTPIPEYFFSMALPAPLTLQANTGYWISIHAPRYSNATGDVFFSWEHGQYDDVGPGFAVTNNPVTGPWSIHAPYMRLSYKLER
jgi:hypothetical protein